MLANFAFRDSQEVPNSHTEFFFIYIQSLLGIYLGTPGSTTYLDSEKMLSGGVKGLGEYSDKKSMPR